MLKDESGFWERNEILNLKEEATLTEEPTRVAKKHQGIDILKVDNKPLRIKDRLPRTQH